MKIKLIYCLLLLSGILQGMQDQRNRLIEHLVVNNDMPLLASLKDAQGVMPERISSCLKELSVKHKKPHILILACSQPGMADSVDLTRWVTAQDDLTPDQIDTYYSAFDLIKKRKPQVAQFNHKVLAQGSAGGKQLPRVIQNLCKEYLPHTEHHLNFHRMHPELEKAIIAGDINKVQHLIKQGYNLAACTADYMDALELATHRGQAEIFRELIKHVPYINPQKQKVLLTYAQGDMIPIITKELPEYIARKNQELSSFSYSASRMIALISSGANPNMTGDFFDDLLTARALQLRDLPKLKILLRHGANPNFKNIFNMPATLQAIIANEPKYLKVLLEHGADAQGDVKWPLTHDALIHNSPACLRVLLEHGANPNATLYSDTFFFRCSLLKRAKESKQKDELVPLLKQYGARYTTLEKYPELINVPLGILAGSLFTAAQGAQVTGTSIVKMGAVAFLSSIATRMYSSLTSN